MSIAQVPSPLVSILASKTYNAAWFEGATFEAQIQNAMNKAVSDGASFVFIPLHMEGYNPSLITVPSGLQLVTETKLMRAGGGGLNVVDVSAFPGATAGDKLIAALAAAPLINVYDHVPVVFDMRAFTGVQVIDKPVADYGIGQYSKSVMVFLWGTATYWISTLQKAMSNHIHVLDGATLVFGKNANGSRQTGVYGFFHDALGCQLITTAGSGVVTLTGNAAVQAGIQNAAEVGHPLAIFGHVPAGGRDNTTVGADPGAGGTSIQVASTTGFPSSGYLVIPNNAATDYEAVQYTSIDATHFLGCTRGYGGTTAVAHNVGTAVDRAVYETYIIKSIAGNTITLDEGRTVPFTSTLIDAQKGTYNFTIEGHGTVDGNMDPAVDDSINPAGVYITYGRHCRTGAGITWRNWDHSAVIWRAGQDNYTYGRVIDSTRPSLLLGSATWLFANCKRCYVEIDVENTYIGCYVDSRTITGQLLDGPSNDNVVIINHARKCENPIRVSGSQNNLLIVRNAVDLPATGQGIAEDSDAQWITSANALGKVEGNILVVETIRGAAGFQAISTGSTFGTTNVLISRTAGAPISAPVSGSTVYAVQGPTNVVILADAATIATNASKGETFEVTLGGNRTMGAPSNIYKGKRLKYVIIQDGAGGRTLAWNAVFKHTWSDAGNTLNKRSTIEFYCYDGTNFAQVGAQGPYV